MRVLQLVDCLTRTGGLERYVERFSQELVARRHASAIVEVKPDLSMAPPRIGGVEVSRDDAATFAEQWRPDFVLSHHSGDAPLLRQLCSRYPLGFFVHTVLCPGGKLLRRRDHVCTHPMGTRCLFDWYVGPCGRATSPLAAMRKVAIFRDRVAASKNAAVVLVASEWMRRHAIQEGIDANKIQVVDISEGIGPPIPVRPVAAGDRVRLLYVGRVTYDKGIQYAVRGLLHLPRGFTLRVVGDGWYRPRLEKLTRDIGLVDRVSFDGMLDAEQTRAAYANSDVLVVTSIVPEGAGLIVPEGRAAGLRVVVFDRGGLVDWVRSGRVDQVTVARKVAPKALADAILESLGRAPGASYSLPIIPHAPPRPMLAILEELMARAHPAAPPRP